MKRMLLVLVALFAVSAMTPAAADELARLNALIINDPRNIELNLAYARAAETVAPANPIRYPSGGALATMPIAIAPPAPGRFSMTSVCPNCFSTFGCTMRAIASELPPAGNPTTRRIARSG